jgi:6-phosphogluconolactonase
MHFVARRFVSFSILLFSLASVAAVSGQSVPKFLYVVNYDTVGSISGYYIEPLTGQPTPMPGSPFPGGVAMQGIALTPDQRFLYAAGIDVVAYSVNQQNGSLTQIATYPVPGGSGRAHVTPDGQFLYVVGNGINGFAIDSSSGALTVVSGSPVNPNTSYSGISFTPNSAFAYASALLPNNEVDGFTIQPDGELFPMYPTYPNPNTPIDIVVEPSGRLLYVDNYGGGSSAGISGYAINSGDGSLTDLPGSPYGTGGQAPNAITASPNGRAIVVDNQVQNTTASLRIQSDGSLVLAGTPQPSAYDPGNVIVDPTNEFVYTSGVNGNAVSANRLNPVTQALEPVPGMQWPTGANPYDMAVVAGPESPYCPLNETEPSLTLCAPTTASASPVRVVAGTTSSSLVTQMQVSVDGVNTYSSTGINAIDVPVEVSAGSHTITVAAQNHAGQKFAVSRSISVSGSGPSPCTNHGIYPNVAVCSPLAGATTGTSIHLIAQSYWYGLVSSTAVYLDGVQVYSVSESRIDTYINVSAGVHSITVQSTDPNGQSWSSTVSITAN